MISSNGFKRKSSSSSSADKNNIASTTNPISTITKRFRGTNYDGKINSNEHQMPLLSSIIKSEQSKQMTINNQPEKMISNHQLQHELQCQEALLVLMQKLKANQKLLSQPNNNNNNNNNNNVKQRTATPPVNTTKLNQDEKNIIIPAKQQQQSNPVNRSTPIKPPHPNQYTVNRSNQNLQQTSKLSVTLPQAIRQSNNGTTPATATRISSTVPAKNSSLTSTTTNNSSKSNGVAAEQHLLNAKLALRKQLEQTLLQIPTPKPTTCDLTYIPGINGWSEFLTLIGLEQAFTTYTDFLNRRISSEYSMNLPHICAQCGTDWSVTWHEVPSTDETNPDDKIFCDRCRKTSQKKILKQDHSNRLRQAFMKALQQEKELDAKFQQPLTTVKQPSVSSSASSTSHTKHSTKSLTTKLNQSSKSTNNNRHHHHSAKISSSKPSTINSSATDTLASTLAALQTNEQMEFFQKHFLSNMFPFALANQAALAAKSTQQQQQALAASLPAMAASLMRQQNPAQYLLDMIPQAAAAKQQQQQQHHHRHSK